MRGKKRIVILTDNSSRNTSAALKEAFKDDNDVLTIIIAENELEGYVRNALFNLFFKEESKLRSYYDKFVEFRKARNMNKLATQKISFNSKFPVHRRVHNVFLRYSPDIVIAMTPRVLAPSLAVRDRLRSHTKIAVVLDEFCLNKQMVHKATDYYFVANNTVKEQLVNLNIAEEKIQVSNIPIRQHIQKEIERADALQVLDLADRPTILVVASQYGDERFRKVINALYEKRFDMNIVVACGYNRRLLAFVREKTNFLGLNEGIDMNAAYSCADIVITRPTATVLTEALYKRKLVFTLLPSDEMERRAINYLSQEELVIKAENEDDLVHKLDEHFTDGGNFLTILENIETAIIEEPIDRIAEKIYELMSNEEEQPKQD